MYNNLERDKKYIDKLSDFIEEQYKLRIVSITKAERGFYGETWEINTSDKTYFVKIIYAKYQKEKYKDSFALISYLANMQIDFIPEILKSSDGNLYKVFEDGIIGIFDYVDGENVEDYDLERLLNKLVKIYKLPIVDGSVRKEVIDHSEIDLYKKYVSQMKFSDELVYGKAYEVICKNETFLNHCLKRLEALIDDLKKEKLGEFITHGDAGGNVIVNENEFWIIDWDDPVLAPIERDIWFFAPYVDIKKIMNQLLEENEISYNVSDKWIAFYTYRSLIYYLIESFQALFELEALEDKEKMILYIDETINGWIRKQIAYVNRVDKRCK